MRSQFPSQIQGFYSSLYVLESCFFRNLSALSDTELSVAGFLLPTLRRHHSFTLWLPVFLPESRRPDALLPRLK